MNTQETVDEIHRSMKEEWCMVICYRSPKGREIERRYTEAEILDAVRAMYEPGSTPIFSTVERVKVGTTPLEGDTESNDWRGGIGD